MVCGIGGRTGHIVGMLATFGGVPVPPFGPTVGRGGAGSGSRDLRVNASAIAKAKHVTTVPIPAPEINAMYSPGVITSPIENNQHPGRYRQDAENEAG